MVLTEVRKTSREGTFVQRSFAEQAPLHIYSRDDAVTFEFAALDFTNPRRNRYAVRMQGLDNEWIQLGNRRQVTYANLPAGRHALQVQAASEDGVWNQNALSVQIIVHPPFWKTGWFAALTALAGVVLISGTVLSVSRRRYQRQLLKYQAREALQEERDRISRDMHDEVGANLSEIAILSELARQNPQADSSQAGSATDPVERIARKSRATLDSIGEIIWAINPDNDHLDPMSAYLREFAAEFLEETGARFTARFPRHLPRRTVSAEFRRNVFLILKEALHNVVKHAQARDVTVALSCSDEHFILEIEDDGVGFAAQSSGTGGQGLGNMLHRAREFGGQLDLESRPAKGCRVRLRAPLRQAKSP